MTDKQETNPTETSCINCDDYTISTKNYSCITCSYTTTNKKDYKKHLLTNKHIKNHDGVDYTEIKNKQLYKCNCGNEYKYRQGLHAHKKVCKYIAEQTKEPYTIQSLKEAIEDNKKLRIESNEKMFNIFTEQRDMNNILIKGYQEQKDTIRELMKENEGDKDIINYQRDVIENLSEKLIQYIKNTP
tara:strand:+ start:635 stop:1192 length:558 start_codon:yes stop_codon:yes gene_type:complete